VTGKTPRLSGYSIVPLGIVLLASFLLACSSQQNTAKPPDPEIVLQRIPAADAAQLDRVREMKDWRNPYLIVGTEGVALLDAADNAEIKLKPDELLPALAALPASSWPYGRVVAAAESGERSSEKDGIAIRRNKGIVGGMLAGAHVGVRWVPSS
jgi:hypothetical protein